MPAYIVADIDVHDPARYEQYKQLAPASIEAHGGRYLVRGGNVKVLEGDWQLKRFVILEFPSVADAQRWWDSADYAPAKRLRQETTTTSMILVEGAPAK
jgi:uncharacterized protein (DUF1330 family)